MKWDWMKQCTRGSSRTKEVLSRSPLKRVQLSSTINITCIKCETTMGEEKGACKFSFRSTQNWQFSVSKCTIMIAILISMILLFLSSLEYKILHIITLCTYNIRHWAQTLRIPITIFLCSCLDILYVMYLSLLSSRKAQLHQKAYFIWKTSRAFCWNFWRLFICKEVKHLVLQLYPLFLFFLRKIHWSINNHQL
jgi:hypothetical protein